MSSLNNYKDEKCPECGEYHVFIKNKPCKKCGSDHNNVTQVDGFTNWDDDEEYEIICGNLSCGHRWTITQ